MQILIVDNNIDPDSWGASELCQMARLVPGSLIRVRRAPHDDLPRDARSFDRIIVSGSKTSVLEEAPWISKLEEFVRHAVQEATPLLGVCYGHQILARALGSKQSVRKTEHGEFGWAKVELLPGAEKSPLMKKIPKSFHTFEWHLDEVCELPSGMRALARSEACPIQACQLEGRPAYGVQFHPERAFEEAEKSLKRRFKENPKARFLNRQLGKKLFDAKIGEAIFRNFLEMETP